MANVGFLLQLIGHIWMLFQEIQDVTTCSLTLGPIVSGVFLTLNTSVMISSLRYYMAKKATKSR